MSSRPCPSFRKLTDITLASPSLVGQVVAPRSDGLSNRASPRPHANHMTSSVLAGGGVGDRLLLDSRGGLSPTVSGSELVVLGCPGAALSSLNE